MAAVIACHNLILRRAVHNKRLTCIGNVFNTLVQAVSYLMFGTYVFGIDVITRIGFFAA